MKISLSDGIVVLDANIWIKGFSLFHWVNKFRNGFKAPVGLILILNDYTMDMVSQELIISISSQP